MRAFDNLGACGHANCTIWECFEQEKRLSWPEYAMKLAEVAALRSEDKFQKVGACILRHDNSVLSLGYNGTPPNKGIDFGHDREKRRPYMSHAELSALRYAKPNEGKLIACTLRPCQFCMVQLAMYGIYEIYYKEEYERDTISLDIAKEYGIILHKL